MSDDLGEIKNITEWKLPANYKFGNYWLNKELFCRIERFEYHDKSMGNGWYDLYIQDRLKNPAFVFEGTEHDIRGLVEETFKDLARESLQASEVRRLAITDLQTLCGQYKDRSDPEEFAVQVRNAARKDFDELSEKYGSRQAVEFLADLIWCKPKTEEDCRKFADYFIANA